MNSSQTDLDLNNPARPASYGRRILLAVTGMTPQILTETLYALAFPDKGEAFIPTEVHVLTTAEGARQIELRLLDPEKGHFHAFCREYGFPDIHFTAENIRTLTRADGSPLEDIRSPEENELAADALMEWVRSHTADMDSAIHVSLAGGRKTMGFYAGYALSLFGREQDRLSHVLVSEPFELFRDFFYPPREPRVFGTEDGRRTARSTDAKIHLAEIPFVRLRYGLPEAMIKGGRNFSEAVRAAQEGLGPIGIEIDVSARTLRCGGRLIKMAPAQFAFYLWHARRAKELGSAAPITQHDADNATGHSSYLETYLEVLAWDDSDTDYLKTKRMLDKDGFGNSWSERKTLIKTAIEKQLQGTDTLPYILSSLPSGNGKTQKTGLTGVPPERILIYSAPRECS